MAVVWSRGVAGGILTPSEFVRAVSTNAAKLFNMYPQKGIIQVIKCSIYYYSKYICVVLRRRWQHSHTVEIFARCFHQRNQNKQGTRITCLL